MTNGINTRELILQILLEIEEEGKHSHIAVPSKTGESFYHQSM